MTWLLVKYIMTAAVRDRILLGFIAVLGVGISLSIFIGSSAITEKDQFSLVFAAGGLRIAGLITLVLFTVFYLRRSFDTRDVEYMLSRPISRIQFLLAHSLAFSILATIAAVLITAIIYFMPGDLNASGLCLWGISIWAELIIMVNVAMFFAFVLNSAVTGTLMTLAFYLLARLMGGILGIIALQNDVAARIVIEKIMLLISIVVPRLDMMGQTSWLLYGVESGIQWPFIIFQVFVFLGFIFSATLIDLKRRQF